MCRRGMPSCSWGGVSLSAMILQGCKLVGAGRRGVAAVAVAVCLIVPSLGVSAAGAQEASESSAMLHDIELRDLLIANQEALLNTYRCLFDTDTHVVPGGCADGTPGLPAQQPTPFEGMPTSAEVELRDQLISNQEALLNTYRCLFNVDTQIVPGGCADDPDPAETTQPSVSTTATIVSIRDGACALTPEQTIACWHPRGQAVVPSGPFAIIKSIASAFCGIREDQSIVCWNWRDSWYDAEQDRYRPALVELELPEGQFTDIALGGSGLCGWRVDQTIACWNRESQRDDDGNVHRVLVELDVLPGQFTDITGFNGSWCGTRADQTIACWFWGGKLDDDGNRYLALVELDVLPGQFTDITGSNGPWCGTRLDQTVACWNWEIQRDDDGNWGQMLEELELPDGQLTDIEVAAGRWCGLRSELVVACWNWEYQQDDDGNLDLVLVESELPDGQFSEITSFSQTSYCGSRAGLIVVCWSLVSEWDDDGNRNQVLVVSDLPDGQFTDVFVTHFHSFWCGLRTVQTVACWPEANVPDGWTDQRLSEGQIIAIEFQVIGEGSEYWCALRHDGELICSEASRPGGYG